MTSQIAKKVFSDFFAPMANAALSLVQVHGRPILVLGTNRGGTTWVGNTLGLASEALYYNAPGFMQGDRTRGYYARAGQEESWMARLWDPAFAGTIIRGML